MGTCEWWMFIVTSVVILVLYTLLLLTLYIMLSRKIARHFSGMQGSSSPVAQPTPAPAPAPAAGGEGAQNPAPAYAGSSDTSSETSEDSADSPSCPQGPGPAENINYTSLVFVRKDHGPDPDRDYENMKAGVDYVNVDPKKKKANFWPLPSLVGSKAVEYTEVKL